MTNGFPLQGIERAAGQRAGFAGEQRTQIVERATIAVEHPSEQAVAHRQMLGPVLDAALGGGGDPRLGRGGRRFDRTDMGAGGESEHVLGRHHEQALAVEADHLGLHRRCALRFDAAVRPQGQTQTGGFHHQAIDPGQASGDAKGIGVRHLLAAGAQVVALDRRVHGLSSVARGGCHCSSKPSPARVRCQRLARVPSTWAPPASISTSPRPTRLSSTMR